MSELLIDFQGIIDLDQKRVGQLEQFLENKESRLANQMLHLLSPTEKAVPIISRSGLSLKFSEAIEIFSKKRESNHPPSHESINDAVRRINGLLWEFIEILEGCVVELFQQAGQIRIDRWHTSIWHAVQAMKEILLHRIEDLMWVIPRLEKPLKECFQKFTARSKGWRGWFSFRTRCLDQNLLVNLQQAKKCLNSEHEALLQRYSGYMSLNLKMEKILQTTQHFPILTSLDVSDQHLYIDLFRLLKMMELNHPPRKEITAEMTRALKLLTSVKTMISLLEAYHLKIKEFFFKSSLEWKSLHQRKEGIEEASEGLQKKVKVHQEELRKLIQTMSCYRLFILKNDPNPYVRSRWGFTEWIVAPEPKKGKILLNMIYLAQELASDLTEFEKHLRGDPLAQQSLKEPHEDIENLLHEMGQPLVSHSVMRSRAERLLDHLKGCNEMGSPHLSTIDYVEDVLSKAMREDWRYHVLHELPLFHRIYRLHQGLVQHPQEPAHAFRMERFHLLFNEVQNWVEKEEIDTHSHEIQLDMNDMKTLLQDFFASIQRILKQNSLDPVLDQTLYTLPLHIHRARQQLLDYRYLFGQFFLNITSKSGEGTQLRNQFLFVDQFFQSIENLLNPLKLP